MAQAMWIERETRTAGDIIQDVVRDVKNIVRSEVQLAQVEMSDKALKAARGGAMLGAAAVVGLLCGMAIVAACIAALAIVMPIWTAALVMGALLCVTAAMLYSAGRGKLKNVKPVPERTTQTLKENLQWARLHTR